MELPSFELPAGRFTFTFNEGEKPRLKCLDGDKRFVPKLEALFDALNNAETRDERLAITQKIMNVGGVDDYLETDESLEEDGPVPIH